MLGRDELTLGTVPATTATRMMTTTTTSRMREMPVLVGLTPVTRFPWLRKRTWRAGKILDLTKITKSEGMMPT